MKKIFFSLLLCGTILSVSAQTTTRTITTNTYHHRYYYYPEPNIYYDEASGNYWYWDNGASQWTMTQTLPGTIVVGKKPKYMVAYNGDDPWKYNDADRVKYKVKKNGKIKIKPKYD